MKGEAVYEDPSFAVAARQGALRAEADRYRLGALVRCCRESLRVRIAERLAAWRAAPCPTC